MPRRSRSSRSSIARPSPRSRSGSARHVSSTTSNWADAAARRGPSPGLHGPSKGQALLPEGHACAGLDVSTTACRAGGGEHDDGRLATPEFPARARHLRSPRVRTAVTCKLGTALAGDAEATDELTRLDVDEALARLVAVGAV